MRGGAPPSVRCLGWVEVSIDGSCARKILVTARGLVGFVISKKLSRNLVIPFATKGAVPAVEAFAFCVGLALLAR